MAMSLPLSTHVLHTNASRANSGHVAVVQTRPWKGFQPASRCARSLSISVARSCVKTSVSTIAICWSRTSESCGYASENSNAS